MSGVLGLDLAKLTGVAWIGGKPSVGPRPWETSVISIGASVATRGDHFFVFQKQIDELLRVWKPGLVVFEEVRFIGGGKQQKGGLLAFRMNAILCGITMVRCEAFGIPYEGVGVSTLKAFARRGCETKENGRPTKADMAEFARARLFGSGRLDGAFPENASTDEMDALWTAWYGIEKLAKVAA